LLTICPGWPWMASLLISACQVARITGVSHQCPAHDTFFKWRMPNQAPMGRWEPLRWCSWLGGGELARLKSVGWAADDMWPMLWTVVWAYAPCIMFPVAFMAVGHHLEWFIRRKASQAVERSASHSIGKITRCMSC
jgi:hypothetical protein